MWRSNAAIRPWPPPPTLDATYPPTPHYDQMWRATFDAGIPPARICAGGAQKWASLPRTQTLRSGDYAWPRRVRFPACEPGTLAANQLPQLHGNHRQLCPPGARAFARARRDAIRYRRPFPSSQHIRICRRRYGRASDRRGTRDMCLPGTALGDPNRECLARIASGRRRAGALPTHVAIRATWRLGATIHALGNVRCTVPAGAADRGGAESSRHDRDMARLRRPAARRRRNTRSSYPAPSVHRATERHDRGLGWLWTGHLGGRRDLDRRRQYRGLYPHDDNRHHA